MRKYPWNEEPLPVGDAAPHNGAFVPPAGGGGVGPPLPHDALVDAEEKYRALVEQLPLVIYIDEPDARATNVYTSPQTTAILGYTPEDWQSIPHFFSTILHPADHERVLAEHARTLATGEPFRAEYRLIRPDGREVWMHDECLLVCDQDGTPVRLQGYMLDITAHKQSEALAESHARLLESIATGLELPEVLDLLTRFVEDWSDDVLCSILLLDRDGVHLRHGAAPSLPDAYTSAVDGVAIGPSVGSCGTAAFRRECVAVTDIATDPLWRGYSDLALAAGLRACWSTPIFAIDGTVLGTFAMYYGEPCSPDDHDRRLVEVATHAASIAIEHTRSEEALRASQELYRDLFENASEPIAIVDLDDTITDVNLAFQHALGYKREELLGSNIKDFLPPEGRDIPARQRDRKLSGEVAATTYEQEFIAKKGRRIVFEVSSRVIEEDGRPIGIQGVCRDITERRETEQAILRLADENRHQSLHDPLTGLPNRTLFSSRVRDAIGTCDSASEQLAVLLIDLDRFKEINDTLGHHYGDLVLVELARRFESSLRRGDTIARLGGDEFGMLLPELAGDVNQALERILTALEEPLQIDGLPLHVEASIGIALYPDDGRDVGLLLQHADTAMYIAKKTGAVHTRYERASDRYDTASLALLAELPRALREHELVLHYQPKADVATRELASIEALVRWQHPTRGLIPPAEFIPLAEQTALIHPLTLYVIDEALGQCASWEQQGLRLGVAVNLSPRNLYDLSLPGKVAKLLRKWDVPGERLTLEITERGAIADSERAGAILVELSELGITISIDDFGVGYTSLAQLARLCLNQIKIDRSFVADMGRDNDGTAIVRSIITLGHDLGLEVVAEGVETRAAWDGLADLGCDTIQGYYVSRPLPADDLGRLLLPHAAQLRGEGEAAA